MTHPLEKLRPLRPELVRAAEAVFDSSQHGASKELKSQLNHLIAVCNEATCHDEIALYLHYQASRDGKHIGMPLADAMIEGITDVFKKHSALIVDDAVEVTAWRLYAVYLARAFTYRKEVARSLSQRNTSRDNAPRRENR